MTTTLLLIGLGACGITLLQLAGFTASSVSGKLRETSETRRRLNEASTQLAHRSHRIEQSKGFQSAWSGWRKLRVVHTEMASADCKTFVFADPDGGPMPFFIPGQFLMVGRTEVGADGRIDQHCEKPLDSRCYSLSDAPAPSHLRITVKRVPNGVVSNWLHDHVREGDVIPCRSPSGRFVLDTRRDDLIVCLAAGVGVTPMASMANYVAKMQPNRPIVIFLSSRDSAHCPLVEELRKLARSSPYVTVVVLHSAPQEGDQYDLMGRINIDLISRVISRPVGSYYLCGPMAFMTSLSDALIDWGVPKESVSYESFGGEKAPAPAAEGPESANVPVKFAKSGKTIGFKSSDCSLLDAAESAGIQMEADCRAGACGTCLTKILKGAVEYDMPPSFSPIAKDECLACVAKPTDDMVVDA